MMDCSIIIVNFNTRLLTTQTIESVVQNTKNLAYEIIVVDNSTNAEEYYAPKQANVSQVIKTENKGFGNACNLGASMAKGEYLLFLNSDTLVQNDTLRNSFDYIKGYKDIGILGCRILLENGTLDHGCKRGFPTPLNSAFYFLGLDRVFPKNKRFGAYRLLYLDEMKQQDVDSVSGAFLMIRKALFVELDGFDEDYFMYGEDLDLCFRVKAKGLRVVYFPDASITHLKGQSGLRTASKKTIYHFYDAMLIFYRKHYRKKYGFLLYALIYIAIKAKYCISVVGKN